MFIRMSLAFLWWEIFWNQSIFCIQWKREGSEEKKKKGRSVLVGSDGVLFQQYVPASKRQNKLENYQHFLINLKDIFSVLF